MKSSHAKTTGSSTYSVDRRTVLKRTGQAALAVSGASLVGVDGILAAGRAPALLQDAGEPSGTVRMLLNAEPDYMEGVFAAFREQYPNVEIDAQGITGETWAGFADAVATRIAGGEVYDIVQIATEGQRLFASRGLVAPIDSYIERDQAAIDEYFTSVPDNLLNASSMASPDDGNTYFLPGEFNTMGIWYNAEMFAQAGVQEPDAEWTWETFREAALALSVPGEVFGMHVPAALFVTVMPWLLTNGASPLNEDWSEATINTPEAIEAAEFLHSLVADGISPEPGGEFDRYTTMAQGRLAMYGSGRWGLMQMRELGVIENIKIASWPRNAGPGTPIGWKAYPIMEVSENKEAAWAFTKFMTTVEASQALAVLGGRERGLPGELAGRHPDAL
jgi:multiple sugar transport system substrate-binding protein